MLSQFFSAEISRKFAPDCMRNWC